MVVRLETERLVLLLAIGQTFLFMQKSNRPFDDRCGLSRAPWGVGFAEFVGDRCLAAAS